MGILQLILADVEHFRVEFGEVLGKREPESSLNQTVRQSSPWPIGGVPNLQREGQQEA